MMIFYQILLIIVVGFFGLMSIGLKEKDHGKTKSRSAIITGVGIVSLLVTFIL